MVSTNKLNKVDFLKGTQVLPVGEIEPAEWLELINHVLELCKPHLKYLLKFKPLGESLNYSRFDKRETKESIMVFPEGINQKTLCVTILDLTPEPEEMLYDRQPGARSITEQTLLLSQKGKWLHRELKYERKPQYSLGLCKGVLETVQECTFTILDVKLGGLLHVLLLRLHEKNPAMLLQILDSFESLLADDIREREERLQKKKHIHQEVMAMRDRIKT